ncbi:chemotaxis protein CheR [Burkholderia ubonensis]|nr:chemotaxis protein CheR [Burkholderia ubonensis]
MESSEFRYTDADFRRISRHVYECAGISMTPAKRSLVYGRLARRLRLLGLTRFSDYLDRLEADPASDEWEHFVNALTTNLTYFFRESYHFESLAQQMCSMRERFRIWCAAASTGEEPYSLAITACETRGASDARVEIVASDIDTRVLAQAERGVYKAEQIEKLSYERRRDFFLRGKGENDGFVKVRPVIRSMIEFKQINLLDNVYRLEGKYHAIFCRNVLIYFDSETQQKVLRTIAKYLAPTGRLYIGHSENLRALSDLYAPRGRAIYGLIHERDR